MKKLLTTATCTLALCGTLLLSTSVWADKPGADVQAQGGMQIAQVDKPVKKRLSRKERNKLDGVECKRVRETGSRVSKKVCTTSAQRAASARRERDKVNALEDRAIITTPGAN